MNNHLERIQHFRVTSFVIGLAVGRALGARIEQTIDTYIAGRAHARGSDPHPGDDEIEKRNPELMTAYANAACPASSELWYTFGG